MDWSPDFFPQLGLDMSRSSTPIDKHKLPFFFCDADLLFDSSSNGQDKSKRFDENRENLAEQRSFGSNVCASVNVMEDGKFLKLMTQILIGESGL